MQVGDLVRVYNFSHTARKHYKARYNASAHDRTRTYIPADLDRHVLGLILSDDRPDPDHVLVMIPEWNQQDLYHEDRIEVINASR